MKLELLFIVSFHLFSLADAHIGEPCNILKLCLPLQGSVYCADDNICRCRKDTPVQIGHHTCSKPKKYSQRCKHLNECKISDPNLQCSQTTYFSQCECIQDYAYDALKGLCVPDDSTQPISPTLLLPSAAGILILFLSVLCCCLLLWHTICRKARPPRRRTPGMEVSVHLRRRSEDPSGQGGNRVSSDSATVRLPSYDTALYDEAPPSYEDVVKGTYQAPDVVDHVKS